MPPLLCRQRRLSLAAAVQASPSGSDWPHKTANWRRAASLRAEVAGTMSPLADGGTAAAAPGGIAGVAAGVTADIAADAAAESVGGKGACADTPAGVPATPTGEIDAPAANDGPATPVGVAPRAADGNAVWPRCPTAAVAAPCGIRRQPSAPVIATPASNPSSAYGHCRLSAGVNAPCPTNTSAAARRRMVRVTTGEFST